MIFNVGPSGSKNIEFVVDGTTYKYIGEEISNSSFKITPNGTNGWKIWIYTSLTIRFFYLATVDICAVGKGGSGGGASPGYPTENGGGGGGGGQVTNKTSQTLSPGVSYSVTIDNSSSKFGDIVTAIKGYNASGRSGGSTGGGSGNGGSGAQSNDAAWPSPTYSGADSGGDGVYAFGDSTFDGVKYAHGGCGGETPGGGAWRGTVYSWYGSGGAGGGTSYNYPTDGIAGIVMLRSA